MILVTGGNGFIGSALVEHLASIGKSCISLQRNSSKCSSFHEGVRYVDADFVEYCNQPGAFEGVDTVVHLASASTPKSSMSDFVRDVEDNLVATLRLVEFAKSAGVKQFVFSSSGGTVYGNPTKNPCCERADTSPLSSYGITKLAIEKYLAIYSSPSFRTFSLRIGNPYGPAQLSGAKIGVIANFLSQIYQEGRVQVWGQVDTVRDYIYISDLVSALISVVENEELPTGIYNIGTGKGHSLNEIIQLLACVSGEKFEVCLSAARQFDVREIVLDISKFSDATGWKPRVSLVDGIQIMCDMAKSNVRLGKSANA